MDGSLVAWFRRGVVLAASACLLWSCSKENNIDQSTSIGPGQSGKADEGVACKVNEECSSGVCLAGFCRVTCDAASGCTRPGGVCLYDGVGAPGGCSLPAEDSCKADADCGGLFACGIDDRCRSRCTGECKQGQYCVEGACYDKTEAGKIGEAIQCIEEKRPALFCEGAQLVSCNAPGKPGREPGDTCATGELCLEAVASNAAACPAAACEEGQKRCNPTTFTAEACNGGRTGFVVEANAPACKSATLCEAYLAGTAPTPLDPKVDPALTAEQACTSGVCAANQTRCFEGHPHACRKDLSGFSQEDDCGASKQCNAAQGTCFSLAIDAHEVTRGEYHAFLQKPPPSAPAACKQNVSLVPGSDDPAATWPEPSAVDKDLPVTEVDWCDAFAYCQAQGKHLCGKVEGAGAMVPLAEVTNPSVNEWLNACSSGGEFEFVYDHQYSSARDCADAAKTGGKGPRSALTAADCVSPRPAYKGLANLLGNVAEWVNACEATEDAGAFTDGCRALGGGYSTEFNKAGCTTGASTPTPRSTRSPGIGFRCCG